MNFNKIKIHIGILMAVYFCLHAQPVTSQTASSNKALEEDAVSTNAQNYAVLVRKVPHIKASIKTARQMTNDDAYQVGNFEVIICGKVVKQLRSQPSIQKLMKQGRALEMQFHACGMSMKKFGIDPSELASGISVVRNGITHMFDLQAQGYLTVEL